jgi:hypothetical protein
MPAATGRVETKFNEAAKDPLSIKGVLRHVRVPTHALAGDTLREPLAPSRIAFQPTLTVCSFHHNSPGVEPTLANSSCWCGSALIDAAARATRLFV